MNKPFVIGIAGAAVALAALASGYVAVDRPAPVPVAQATQQQEAAVDPVLIEGIVRNYLLQNPEILNEMQEALDQRERDQQRVSQLDTITTASEQIFNAAYDGIVGNPEGDVTIVEFFDYNCGFCKRAYEDMEAMIAVDPDLRFVLKEFPILGPDSQNAHVVSMAFRALAPERYGDFHRDLMMGGRATEDRAVAVALAHGADEDELRAEMENPAIKEAFGETYQLAARLSITGTPSYVVGSEVVFGALGQTVLEEKVALARAGE